MTATTKTSPSPKKATALLRVSTNRQSKSGLGLASQLASILAYSKEQGIKVERVIREEGISGSLSLDKRAGLLQALAAVEQGEILIVAKRDRASREPLVMLTIESLLKKKKATLVSVAGEGTNSSEPTMVLLRRMTDAVSEWERLVIQSRVKSALAAKKAKGHYLGRVPYGYKRFRNKLVEKPSEQAVINQAITLREEGKNYYQIAKVLKEQGTFNSKGTPYQSHQIKSWIEREK